MTKTDQDLDKLSAAISLAADVHNGQTDLGGEAYILHPLHVMGKIDSYVRTSEWNEIEGFRLDAMIVAVLHDVLEDYRGERVLLRAHMRSTFGDRAMDAIEAVTKRPNESRAAYLDRCSKNHIACLVKRQDLLHNADISRLNRVLTKADDERRARYLSEVMQMNRVIAILSCNLHENRIEVDGSDETRNAN